MTKKRKANIRPRVFVTLALVTVLLNGTIFYIAFGGSREPDRATEVPPYFSSGAAAGPLPPTLPSSQFADKNVAAAYRSAGEIPSVLAQQPCLCHCRRLGHRSLLDCFTTRHGADCATCMKEALFSLQEYRRGLTPQQIRAEILRDAWKSFHFPANE